MDAVGVAGGAGEVRGGAAAGEEDFVLFLRHAGNAQGDGGVGDFEDDIDAITVEPLPHDADADIGFVLMVGGDHFHVEAVGLEFGHGHLGCGDGAGAGDVLIGAGHIGQHAELYGRRLGPRGQRETSRGGGGKQMTASDTHGQSPRC